jgi:hypothetical protein
MVDFCVTTNKLKGEGIMIKFNLMIKTMNRFRLLLVMTFVLAAMALSGATYAAQEPAAATQTTGQDAVAKQQSADQAARARAMKDAALKRRQDAQKFLNEHSTGYQPGTDGTAPSNTGTGGVK